MEDDQIVELYCMRDSTAINETQTKYGKHCRRIAYGILRDNEDAEECENDTYLKAWNIIPPDKPNIFSAFLSKITRNIAIDKHRKENAKKRGAGQYELIVEELSDCLPSANPTEHIADNMVVTQALNTFLSNLPERTRKVFMRRYWYMSSIKEIAYEYDMSQSNVKMILLRTRNELKRYLEKEGIEV